MNAKQLIKEGFKHIEEERAKLIKRLEDLCPPCKFSITTNDEEIKIKDNPTTSGKLVDFFVNLKKAGETPEEWLRREIKSQEDKMQQNGYQAKNKKIKNVLDSTAKSVFGISTGEALEKKICVKCGKDAKEFKDALSEKEYWISALCQICQDEFFGDASELQFETSDPVKKGDI